MNVNVLILKIKILPSFHSGLEEAFCLRSTQLVEIGRIILQS